MRWSKSCLTLSLLFVLNTGALAEELSERDQQVVNKGLEALARLQNRDGHWESNGQYPVAMTGLSGLALLVEGSTLREGKYADNLRRAVEWLMDRTQASGLIGNPNNPMEASIYMYGHGFSLMFLACVYGEEDDIDRRKRLEKILTKAVEYSGKAQTDKGGWGYVSANNSGGFDEGSVTITQLQGIRAAKNAGIVVPKSIIDKAVKYLADCTTDRGGVIYSLSSGRAVSGAERAPITAAAVCCSFSAGGYTDPNAKKWIQYCQQAIPIDKSGRDSFGHWEYTHYYYAQVVYCLGEDRYAKLFPKSREAEQLRWSSYKKVIFEFLREKQGADGTWNISYIGPVFSTATVLTIMQLDNGTLPIHQR